MTAEREAGHAHDLGNVVVALLRLGGDQPDIPGWSRRAASGARRSGASLVACKGCACGPGVSSSAMCPR